MDYGPWSITMRQASPTTQVRIIAWLSQFADNSLTLTLAFLSIYEDCRKTFVKYCQRYTVN